MLYWSQGVVDFDEVPLTVILQDQGVEVQPDSVAGVGPQPPLKEDVGRVRGVRKPRRLDDARFTDVNVERLSH